MSQGSWQGKSPSAAEKFSAEECSIFLTPLKADIPVTADLCYSKLFATGEGPLAEGAPPGNLSWQLKSAPLTDCKQSYMASLRHLSFQ